MKHTFNSVIIPNWGEVEKKINDKKTFIQKETKEKMIFSSESIFELQKTDCNCNDCVFMDRDFEKYKMWEKWNKDLQQKEFDKKKKFAFDNAISNADERGRTTLLILVNKMKFQFDKSCLLQYGNCKKLGHAVSFLPGMCQPETQNCFKHRKEN